MCGDRSPTRKSRRGDPNCLLHDAGPRNGDIQRALFAIELCCLVPPDVLRFACLRLQLVDEYLHLIFVVLSKRKSPLAVRAVGLPTRSRQYTFSRNDQPLVPSHKVVQDGEPVI